MSVMNRAEWQAAVEEARMLADVMSYMRLMSMERELKGEWAMSTTKKTFRLRQKIALSEAVISTDRTDREEGTHETVTPEYPELGTYADAFHAVGTDLFRLANALKNGPVDFDKICKELCCHANDRSMQTRAFSYIQTNLNNALKRNGKRLKVFKVTPNLVGVKRLSSGKTGLKKQKKKT